MSRHEETVSSPLLSDPATVTTVGIAPGEYVSSLDALRQAVRSEPRATWMLVNVHRVLLGTREYDGVRAKTAGHNWSFVGEALDALVREGLLHRPDGVRYVPTAAARRTWPEASAAPKAVAS